MDLKIDGLPIDLMRDALQQAKEGRIHILDKMQEELEVHREKLSVHAPKIGQSSIPVDRIGDFIGPGGKNIKAVRQIRKLGHKIGLHQNPPPMPESELIKYILVELCNNSLINIESVKGFECPYNFTILNPF